MVGTPTTTAPSGAGGKPTAFGPHGVVQGLPSPKKCVSKRHFIIHIRRYRGISYVEAIVFLNHRSLGVTKSSAGQFTSPIVLKGLPAGTYVVKITVITTTGSIITGTRTYHTCHKKIKPHGKAKL
jgi:hypothetical protein